MKSPCNALRMDRSTIAIVSKLNRPVFLVCAFVDAEVNNFSLGMLKGIGHMHMGVHVCEILNDSVMPTYN